MRLRRNRRLEQLAAVMRLSDSADAIAPLRRRGIMQQPSGQAMRQILIAALLFAPLPGLSQAIRQYKVQLSGDWWSSSYTFLVVEVINDRIIKPRFTDHNNAFGTFKPAKAKWFDYPAKAVRACPLEAGTWGDQSCITSEGESIEMPAGTDLNKFRFDFKYEKKGALLEQSFEYRKLIEGKDSK